MQSERRMMLARMKEACRRALEEPDMDEISVEQLLVGSDREDDMQPPSLSDDDELAGPGSSGGDEAPEESEEDLISSEDEEAVTAPSQRDNLPTSGGSSSSGSSGKPKRKLSQPALPTKRARLGVNSKEGCASDPIPGPSTSRACSPPADLADPSPVSRAEQVPAARWFKIEPLDENPAGADMCGTDDGEHRTQGAHTCAALHQELKEVKQEMREMRRNMSEIVRLLKQQNNKIRKINAENKNINSSIQSMCKKPVDEKLVVPGVTLPCSDPNLLVLLERTLQPLDSDNYNGQNGNDQPCDQHLQVRENLRTLLFDKASTNDVSKPCKVAKTVMSALVSKECAYYLCFGLGESAQYNKNSRLNLGKICPTLCSIIIDVYAQVVNRFAPAFTVPNIRTATVTWFCKANDAKTKGQRKLPWKFTQPLISVKEEAVNMLHTDEDLDPLL